MNADSYGLRDAQAEISPGQFFAHATGWFTELHYTRLICEQFPHRRWRETPERGELNRCVMFFHGEGHAG